MRVTAMEEKFPVQSGETLYQSVYSKDHWPYTSVEEEIRAQESADKPYGPFNAWLYRLGLNPNNDDDLAKSHLLFCILNFAALHDNQIDDTRDFLGFFWWYTDRIKQLSIFADSETRKSAYRDMIVQILLKTDSMVIDLFSPTGDIYSVMLFPGNYALSDYAAIKIKLERIYIAFIDDPDAAFFEYEDLKGLDEEFYNSLEDREIYQTYIEEFFLYELTSDKIRETSGFQKFALIKVPTNQRILLPTEYLCQLAWISFRKIQVCFFDANGNLRNQKVLSFILNRINRENRKVIRMDFAHEMLRDFDTLGTEQEFWKLFLDAVCASKPQELDGPCNIHLYAFLLGAVLPERAMTAPVKPALPEVAIREDDIAAFYDALCADSADDHTYASLLKILEDMPIASLYRGNEKRFIEKALTFLINNRKITKVREPGQKNLSHFLVTQNLFPIFMRSIDAVREAMLGHYTRTIPEGKIRDTGEFRLDLEKRIFSGFPVFYQFYMKKEFAEFAFGLTGKMEPQTAEGYRKMLFISPAESPAFLPLPELLKINFDELKSVKIATQPVVPAEENAQVQPAQVNGAKTPNARLATNITDENENFPLANIPAVKEPSRKEKTVEEEPPIEKLDFFEVVSLIFKKIGSALKSLFRVFSRSLSKKIDEDLEKRDEIIEERKRRKNAPKPRVERTDRGDRYDHSDSNGDREKTYEKNQRKEQKEPEQDLEISLRAIAGNMIEDFTGSKNLPLDEAVASLAGLWNDPKTLNQEEASYQRKENLVKVGTLIRNSTQTVSVKQVNRAYIEERSQEIADYKQIDEMMKNLVQRKETKEIIRRYIALCIISSFLK